MNSNIGKLAIFLMLTVFFMGCSQDKASLSELLPIDQIDSTPSPDGGVQSFAVEIDESSIVDISSINASAYVISGSCDPSAESVSVTVSSPPQTEVAACVNGAFSVTFDLTELTSSTVNIVAQQGTESDSPNQNPQNDQSSAAITVDSAVDIVYSNHLSYSPSGQCSENGQPVVVVVGGVPAIPAPNCVNGTWSVLGMNLSHLPNGLLQMTVDHSDSLGNAAPQVILSLNKNVQTPSVITAPTAPDDPNWSLKLRPGDLPNLNSTNASTFTFSGYCASGQGDVNIIFGSMSFSIPCNDFFGFYQLTVDVSSETATNPIQHCASQATSPVMCSNPITNELAPPGLSFDSNPLQKIAPSNQGAYLVRGSCAPEGANISIDIGTQPAVMNGVCGVDNRFSLSGDVSAVPDGIGISVMGHITSGANTTSTSALVNKGVLVTLNTPANITSVNQSSYTLSGTCSDNGREVLVDIGGYTPSSQPVCSNGLWSLIGENVSSVSDGAVMITVNHLDEFGNSALTQTANILKDSLPPVVVIGFAPDINIGNQNSYSLNGLCSEEGLPVLINIGGYTPPSLPICGGGVWTSSNLNVSSVPAGNVLVSASQTDLAGNFLEVSLTILKDTNAPTLTLNPPANISSTNELSYFLNGLCSEDGENVVVTVGGLSPSVQPICSGGSWAVSGFNVSSLSDGFVQITVNHSDSSGNPALPIVQTITKFEPITFTVSGANCANPYTEIDEYSFAGDPVFSVNAATKSLTVDGVGSWRTLVAQEALPSDFEITFTMNSDVRQMFGFSGTSTPAGTWTGIESLLLFYDNAFTYRYANGSYLGNFQDSSFGGFPAEVRVEKVGGTARYYINGNLVHTDATIPTGVPMYLTFAGQTGYSATYRNIRVRNLNLPVSGFFISGSFVDSNGTAGSYELYDQTNDVVIANVTSPFEVDYSSGLNSDADLVIRSTSNAALVSNVQTVTLSDCLEPLALSISAAGCYGPIEKFDDYTFSGNPTANYDSANDTLTVTGSNYWETLNAQEPLPDDFEISFNLTSDALQFMGISPTPVPSNTWTGIETSFLFYNNSFTYFFGRGNNQGNIADSSFGGFPAFFRIEKLGTTANFYINNNLVHTDAGLANGNMYITFGGANSSYSAEYGNFSVEDLSPSAVNTYRITGSFEDPNGLTGVYELYDVTNDFVISTVSSPFDVVYDSGSNSAAQVVVRRQASPHVASPGAGVNLSTCD